MKKLLCFLTVIMCSCTVRKPHENTSVAENYAKKSGLHSIYPQLPPPYPQDTLNMYVIAHNGTKAYTKDLKERVGAILLCRNCG